MHVLAVGFWGAFFGTATLMLAGALAAFVQSHHRVALAAAVSAIVSGLFVATILGWLPLAGAVADARAVAHVGIFSTVFLGLLLALDLGLLRERARRQHILGATILLAAAAIGVSWLLTPAQAIACGCCVPLAGAVLALPVVVARARRGDRIAWFGVFAVGSLVVALAGSAWIVHDRAAAPWPLHAVSALAGIAYFIGIGGMVWSRHSYLLDVREVLAQGPRYDPVTRMPSTEATGSLVAQAFHRQRQHPRQPMVLVAVAIANVEALEQLHGRAALNHALFVCAGRLRRCAPPGIEMGRLFENGFLLVSHHARDLEGLLRLGRRLAARLSRPVTLRMAPADGAAGELRAAWAPQVGIGLLATTAQAQPAAVVTRVRDLSRAAWAFASRIARQDPAGERIVEVPLASPQA